MIWILYQAFIVAYRDRDALGLRRERGALGSRAGRLRHLDPSNNTMPTLPSHPQRIVGWATSTLASDSLDDAHEYAGHARLHVDVSRAALEPCFS